MILRSLRTPYSFRRQLFSKQRQCAPFIFYLLGTRCLYRRTRLKSYIVLHYISQCVYIYIYMITGRIVFKLLRILYASVLLTITHSHVIMNKLIYNYRLLCVRFHHYCMDTYTHTVMVSSL